MKKQVLIICLGLSSGLVSLAQSVSYKVLTDDPSTLPLQLSLDPFYVEMSEGSARIGWGLRANAIYKKLFSVNMDIRRAYSDVTGRVHVDGDLMSPLHDAGNNGLKKQFVFELGGAFSFSDKIKNRSLKVVLSSSTYGNMTHTTYIMVPGSVRNINGLRGGINLSNTAIAFEDAKVGSFKAVNKANSADFTSFGEFGTSYHGSPVYNGYTMFNVTSLYAGISHKRITNLILDTDYSKRKKGNATWNDFYIDALIGTIMHFKDIKAVDGTSFEVKNSEMKRIGWRVGWVYSSSTRSFATFKAEFGSRPGYAGASSGVLSTRSYLLLTMGWTIPIKIKALNTEERASN